MTLRIRLGQLDVPLTRPFSTALRTITAVRTAVVRVEDADGRVGWGEGPPTPAITGDTWEGIVADLGRAASGPDGAAAIRGETLAERLASLAALGLATATARAALDIALHDLWAQGEGAPLWRLLGGHRPQVVTDVTISVDRAGAMAEAAAEASASGFSVLKVKLGTDAAGDHARLAAVRRAAPAAVLRVDANQGWTPEEAIRLVRGFEDAGLAPKLVEQPVAARDLDGLKRVTDAVNTPILADEAVFTPADARRIVELGAADLLNVKLMKSGGLAGAREICDLAAASGVGCMVGAMMEAGVSIAAAAHLACGHPAVTMADLDPPLLCLERPVVGGVRYEGERVVPGEGPGLGIEAVGGVRWLN